MEFNATIDLIIKDLNDACNIIDDLKNYEGVPELQVEFAKAKCKSAADVIALLKSSKHQPVPVRTEKTAPAHVAEIHSVQIKTPDTAIMVEKQIPDEDKKPLKTTRTKQFPDEPEKKPEKKAVAEKFTVTSKGSAVVADKFTDVPASLNEKLATGKKDADVTEIIKAKPIQSLKEAIGLNDKFIFISEIFNGNKEAYSHAIERLETIRSIADARAVIISYTGNNAENEAVEQLLELVKRKISPDE
jgi:hypothetical protein